VSYLKDVLPASLAHGFDADFAELTMAYALVRDFPPLSQ
jgi:hypothetical protein